MNGARVENISGSPGTPALDITIENGVRTTQGQPYIDQIVLARWQLAGTINLDLNASAYIIPYDYQEQTYVLAEIVIADLAKQKWSSWQTYRVHLPPGTTADQVRDELKNLLQQELCRF